MLCSGFPVAHFKGDRFGLVVAYWGLALVLGVPQVSQTDYTQDKQTFGETSSCHGSLPDHASLVGGMPLNPR